ncbi:winged helix-turn-helix domain-containing protein [Methanosarcina sp. KYL-1]|uniref:helix-turn-helix transcriptional regulator n=1 Tax=Methanosarcina sp. KYL-1 TaxID=2602068 RepID=UPI0021011B74|nr:winged helix-turn-helix domain-containing protein [Methanosarcina sp. KYL-1]MCQ1535892.1 winged helix-turn-helix domain-containing protein [Methanosarcina sp. KYL-1]
MKSELMDLVFLSEKRKNLLLFLKSGPKSMDEIRDTLQASSTSILPQIKKLKEQNLVVQQDKTYELSSIGKVLVEKMQPLVNTMELFEDNFEYWAERDLQGIPPFLRRRIGELGKCKLIKPDLNRMFEFDPEFMENLFSSEHVLEILAYFHPDLTTICRELTKTRVEISLIMADSVLQRCIEDHREDLRNLLGLEYVKIFRYSGDLRIADLTVTDKFLMISLFPRDRNFDRESLISYDPSALKWGTDLFSYLLQNSTEFKEIPPE